MGHEGESVVVDDANISVLVRRGEARDDLHGDSPSLCGIARKRDFKLDLMTGTEDAAITAVTLGEVNESLNVRCRMHFQFHPGSIRSKGSGTRGGTRCAQSVGAPRTLPQSISRLRISAIADLKAS